MGYMKDELSGFVPTETAQDIVKKMVRGSSILRLSKVEPMTTEKKKIPVFAQGAGAYWVGEGERIQTSKAEWIFPELIAKKMAVIIPVTKEKLDDATLDVFEELKDTIAEAFATTIDKAALFGSGSPFATNLLKAIKDHNMIVVESEDIDLTISDAMAMVEEAGYDVDGFAAKIGVKNSLRRLRDANGAPKFVESQDGRKFYEQPIEFVRNGGWEQDKAKMIAGEWRYSLVGIRSDIEYQILQEATLQSVTDSDGKPLSLAEQDMVAIKATMRLGYLVVKQDAFAAIVPGATVSTSKPSSVTAAGAMITGTITTDGAEITETGVAYATTKAADTPTESATSTATQSGTFSVTLTGLTASTTYYARAYVKVGGETRYGNEVSFKTSAS